MTRGVPAIETIERVLSSALLTKELIRVPSRGASREELDDEVQRLGRPLSLGLRTVLARWNGLDLEVIRLYGVGSVEGGIRRLSDEQTGWRHLPGLVIGSDPSGFIYLEGQQQEVLVHDTDGGTTKCVASNLDDLLGGYVFGARSASFAGAEWAAELKEVGLVGA